MSDDTILDFAEVDQTTHAVRLEFSPGATERTLGQVGHGASPRARFLLLPIIVRRWGVAR